MAGNFRSGVRVITDLLLLAAAHGNLCSIEVLSDREVERGRHACDLLTTDVESFTLQIGYGYGYGNYGDGDGYGDGDDYGNGNGNGEGYGYGDIYGDIYGYGGNLTGDEGNGNGNGNGGGRQLSIGGLDGH